MKSSLTPHSWCQKSLQPPMLYIIRETTGSKKKGTGAKVYLSTMAETCIDLATATLAEVRGGAKRISREGALEESNTLSEYRTWKTLPQQSTSFSACLVTGTSVFPCLQTRIYTISSPASPNHQLQVQGLLSLHNHVSQFLIINLIYI